MNKSQKQEATMPVSTTAFIVEMLLAGATLPVIVATRNETILALKKANENAIIAEIAEIIANSK